MINYHLILSVTLEDNEFFFELLEKWYVTEVGQILKYNNITIHKVILM